MANPRKFSEKIALHTQKQAEETAAFEKIMREVLHAKDDAPAHEQFTLAASNSSLHVPPSTAIDSPVHDNTINADKPMKTQRQLSPMSTAVSAVVASSSTTVTVSDVTQHGNHQQSHQFRERGRSIGVGPMRRPADRKIDTSPYGGGSSVNCSGGNIAYLSPPSDVGWRRTSSDSALHQSLQQTNIVHPQQDPFYNVIASHSGGIVSLLEQQQQQNHSHGIGGLTATAATSFGNLPHVGIATSSTSLLSIQLQQQQTVQQQQRHPNHQRKLGNTTNTNASPSMNCLNTSLSYCGAIIDQDAFGHFSDGRPRSLSGIPRVPGINISPTSDNYNQIPISNNTGSLPDLTSVHFPTLNNPNELDNNQHQSALQQFQHQVHHQTNGSSYSPNQQTASGSSISNFPYSANNLPGDHDVSDMDTTKAISIVGPDAEDAASTPVVPLVGSQLFLSVPGRKYNQHNKEQGISLEHQQLYNSNYGIEYQGSPQQEFENTTLLCSPGNLVDPNDNRHQSISNNLLSYRSPKRRPSPVPSPGYSGSSVSIPTSFGENNISAPCSPASSHSVDMNNRQCEQFTSNSDYYVKHAIQQHFEQFSLVDSSVPEYLVQSHNSNNIAQFHFDDQFIDLSPLNDTAPPHTHQNNLDQPKQQHMQSSKNTFDDNASGHHSIVNQTNDVSNNLASPITPNSIPEIVLSDFSSTSDFISDSLELGAMDYAGYQMLSDPNSSMITDPTIEDGFRRDLN